MVHAYDNRQRYGVLIAGLSAIGGSFQQVSFFAFAPFDVFEVGLLSAVAPDGCCLCCGAVSAPALLGTTNM